MPILELTITLTESDLEPDELEEETNILFNRLREFYDELDLDVSIIQLVPETESNLGQLEQKGSGYLPKIKTESEGLNQIERDIEYLLEQDPSNHFKIEISNREKKIIIQGSQAELSPAKIQEYLEAFKPYLN